MKCPKCAAAMELVMYEDISVDRCVACKGIWFDANEQKLIKKYFLKPRDGAAARNQ